MLILATCCIVNRMTAETPTRNLEETLANSIAKYISIGLIAIVGAAQIANCVAPNNDNRQPINHNTNILNREFVLPKFNK